MDHVQGGLIGGRLTVWREVYFALGGQEGVALALAAKLGCELLGGDALERDHPRGGYLLLLGVLVHLEFYILIIEFLRAATGIPIATSGILISSIPLLARGIPIITKGIPLDATENHGHVA